MFCQWAALVSRELLDQLIELLEQSSVSELVYTNNGIRIRLVKREEAPPEPAAAAAAGAAGQR